MPKLTFEFNSKKELEYINIFEKNFCELDLPKQLRNSLADENKAESFIKEKYIKSKAREYEQEWRKIEKDYFNLVEKITRHKWAHKNYRIVLTKYMPGFSNPFDPNSNEFTCGQDYSRMERKYVMAHELFHSHYFNITKRKSPKFLRTELNENCVVLALCFTKIRRLVIAPKNEWMIKGWIRSNPRAARYFKKLLPLWESRKNFDDYLRKSLRIEM